MIELEAVRWITDRFREKPDWASHDLKEAATGAGFSMNAIFKNSRIAALPIRKRLVTKLGRSSWTWTALEGWPPGRQSDPENGPSSMSKIARNYEDDPQVVALRASLANRLDVLQLQGEMAEFKGEIALVKGEVAGVKGGLAEVKERTRSVQDLLNAPVLIHGIPHNTPVLFLANRDIKVPKGNDVYRGETLSYYQIVNCEFRDIMVRQGRDLHPKNCPRHERRYTSFDPRHYQVSWLLTAFPTWVHEFNADETVWATRKGKKSRNGVLFDAD